MNLALSLLVIVATCHDEGFVHNDLSPSNVLLHFDPWKQNVVYIGVCDWGLSGRVVEKDITGGMQDIGFRETEWFKEK